MAASSSSCSWSSGGILIHHSTTTSRAMFEALLAKKTLLLELEKSCSTCTRDTQSSVWASVSAHNSRLPHVAISLSEAVDAVVSAGVEDVCRMVRTKDMCSWWEWSVKERVREMVTEMEKQTKLLSEGGRGSSVEVMVRQIEDRIWKQVGRHLNSNDHVCEKIAELLSQRDQVFISSASHKCAWYLAAVRHSHQHTHTLMYGLNSLSVMLAEQSAKQYRPMTTPIHTHLSTGVLSPLQTSLQLIHTAYTRVSRCSTTSSEHTHFALYLDNIQITLPLLSLLLHTVTVVSCWLTRGFNHTIPSSRMVPAVHLLFEEGVACIAAVREIVGVVNEVTPRSLGSSTLHSPHWLLTEFTQRTHSEIKESLDYLEAQLVMWCERFFTEWRCRCSRLLDQVFPAPAVFNRSTRGSSTPSDPSSYTQPIIDQLLTPLCEAGSSLPNLPQKVLVTNAATLLFYELRRMILVCRRKLKQRTYGQLHVDLQHLVTYITSPDSRLSAETRSTLGQLPVCADMKRAFGTLAGEEVEEEDIGMDRSLEFEGELGKLLSQVTILDDIKLNTNDWT